MGEIPKWMQTILHNPPEQQQIHTIFDKNGIPIGVSVSGGSGPVAAGSADYDMQTRVDFSRDEPVVVIKPKPIPGPKK